MMPPVASIHLQTPLSEVPTLKAASVKMLANEGLTTVGELLASFPSRHEDRRRMEFKGFSPSETSVCHHVRVLKTRLLRFGRGGVFEAVVEGAQDNPMNQQLTLRWFNMAFLQRALAVDMELIVYGKIKEIKDRLIMDHPEYEVVRGEDDEDAGIHSGRIVPVYRLRGGLKQKLVRAAVWRVLQIFEDSAIADILPKPRANGEFSGMSHGRAMRILHHPAEMAELDAAKRYLALEEFYLMQLRAVKRKHHFKFQGGFSHQPEGRLMEDFLQTLPFDLTDAQRRCLEEIRADMALPQPMNRLLHGDVGSGKTVVALAAMLLAVESGKQAAFMAPTQILAEQHYANAKKWLEPLGLRVALRTGEKKSGDVYGPEKGEQTPELFSSEETFADVSSDSQTSDAETKTSQGLSGEALERPRVSQSAPSRTAGQIPAASYRRRRLPHFERPWAIYHVTTTALRLLAPAERDIVLHHVLEAHRRKQIELFAACVMPDHLHLLFEPQPKATDENGNPVFWTLGEIMSGIKSTSSHSIGKAGAKGQVWERDYFDAMVRGDEDLQGRFLYILRNPVDAKLVGEDEIYPWLWTRDEVGRGTFEDVSADGSQETFPGPSARARKETREGACAPNEAENVAANRFDVARFNDSILEKKTSSNVSPTRLGADVVIGTHALLYDEESLSRLGLVVIDEQHKFGVAQRARLIAKGITPDVLVMTATPIPRTLTLTLYGDLDISTIDQRPASRGKIITAVRTPKKLKDVVKFVLSQLEEGRQCYIVYPLIDESEKLDAGAATTGLEEWTKRLKPHAVGLLHGRMTGEQKEAVMQQFRSGEIKALVSTTVIEVGVDVPNATVMMIHDAGRFGLAQIHQLRGRIGRGTHASYCILWVAEKDKETQERLKILEDTSDGFRIAEEDLKRRGPGDVLGQAQSGQAPLRFGELLADTRLVTLARRLAERTWAEDPTLAKPENVLLRAWVDEEMTAATVSIQ